MSCFFDEPPGSTGGYSPEPAVRGLAAGKANASIVGAPIPEVAAPFVGVNASFPTVRTDADGRFALSLPDFPWRYRVYSPAAAPHRVSQDFEFAGKPVSELTLTTDE